MGHLLCPPSPAQTRGKGSRPMSQRDTVRWLPLLSLSGSSIGTFSWPSILVFTALIPNNIALLLLLFPPPTSHSQVWVLSGDVPLWKVRVLLSPLPPSS